MKKINNIFSFQQKLFTPMQDVNRAKKAMNVEEIKQVKIAQKIKILPLKLEKVFQFL